MKLTNTIWPVLAIVAGGLLLRKQKQTSGVGAVRMPREELNAYLNKIVKPCHEMKTAWWASLNKNETLAEYLAEWELRGEPYDRYWDYSERRWVDRYTGYYRDAKCVKQLDFNGSSMREYQALCNMLMDDFDVFRGMGGTNSADPRLDKYKTWDQVPRELMIELREKNAFYSTNCILVSFNGVPQFVVDPQGYDYARYVGICATFNTIV